MGCDKSILFESHSVFIEAANHKRKRVIIILQEPHRFFSETLLIYETHHTYDIQIEPFKLYIFKILKNYEEARPCISMNEDQFRKFILKGFSYPYREIIASSPFPRLIERSGFAQL